MMRPRIARNPQAVGVAEVPVLLSGDEVHFIMQACGNAIGTIGASNLDSTDLILGLQTKLRAAIKAEGERLKAQPAPAASNDENKPAKPNRAARRAAASKSPQRRK